MKFKFLLFAFLLCNVSYWSYGQVAAYSFSQSTAAYTEITGGTVLGTDANDDQVFNGSTTGGAPPASAAGFPLGFSFTYNGVVCNKFAVSSNGYIFMGATDSATTIAGGPSGTGIYNAITTATNPGYQNIIGAFVRDLQGLPGLGELKYLTSGTAPNRVLTVQWKNYRKYTFDGTGDNFNFQIRLLEGSNIIEFHYGTITNNASNAATQVGLRSLTNADVNLRVTTAGWDATTPGSLSNNTITATSTVFPASGLKFIYTPPVPCTGTPIVGTIVPSNPVGCAGSIVNFSVAGTPEGVSGISYQWQGSPIGANTWTNIPGATATTIALIFNASFDIRRIITCANSMLSSNSPTATFTLTPVASVYATLPYSNNFESWVNGCGTSDRPSTNFANTPFASDSSWRRDDQGASASWRVPAFGIYTPTFQSGAFSARFHSSYASSGTHGNLDLYFNGAPTDVKQLSFYNINTSGSDSLEVLLSTDAGTTFTKLAGYGITAAWTLRSITLPATTASSIIRFRATADFGSTDIGLDNLSITLNCVGTPNTGVASTTNASVCANNLVTLNLAGASVGAGISYQWQSSPVGANTFTNIVGATSVAYPFTPTASFDYRCVTTCAGSTLSSNSNTVTVTFVIPTATYATIPFTESFENWGTTCAPNDRPGTNWMNTPYRTDSSWRRHDQGATAGWSGNSGLWAAPLAQLGDFAARFHTYDAAPKRRGNLDFYYNGNNAQTNTLTFYHRNNSGTDTLHIQQSQDGGVTYTTLSKFATATSWTLRTVVLPGNSATSIIRFQAVSDFGTTDIGIDNVNIAFPCTGTPLAGTATTNNANVCLGASANLLLTGSSNNIGLAWQWQSSPVGANTWTNITGATSFSTIVTPSAALDYRCITTCTASTLSANSVPVTVTVGTTPSLYATLPYTESFESWMNGCGTSDRPTMNWNNSPYRSDSSWRRNDQASTAGWSFATGGSYLPAAKFGTYSARFHTYGANDGKKGSLDLYFNGGAGGGKTLNFYHINPTGADSLEVLLSTDAGATFNKIGGYKVAAAWTLRTIAIPTATATSIIRFRATSDYGNDDIGLDSVVIKNDCTFANITGEPTAATTLCIGQAYKIFVTATGSDLIYQWRKNGVDIPGAMSDTLNIPSLLTSDAASYRCVVSNVCTTDTSNSASLTVNTQATVATQPAVSTTLCVGAAYTISVVAAGTPGVYQWKKNGVAITLGGNAATYTIPSVAVADAGTYSCEVTNFCNAVTSTNAVLVVNPSTSITTSPTNQTICLGNTATFNVIGSGLVLTYQWQVNTGAGFTNITGATASLLTVTNPPITANGNKYRCVVSGTCGSVNSGEALLTVNVLPNIVFTNVPARVCLTDTIIQLAATPAGGTWSGPTVTGNSFFGGLAGPGNSIISYSNTNGFGCNSVSTKTISVEDCVERHNNLSKAITIFANPNNGKFNVRLNTDLYRNVEMQITDATGKLIQKLNFNGLRFASIVPVDLGHVQSGIYNLHVFNNDDKASFQFLIQK